MQKGHDEVWNNCLQIIKDNLGNEFLYKTWFEPIRPLKLESNVLTIQVPSQYFCEFLEEHYVNLLKKTIRREIGKGAMLQYSIVLDSQSHYASIQPSEDKYATANYPVNVPLNINSTPTKDFPNPFILPGLKKIKINSQLNEALSFDNFIEGDCNRLARSAGYAVAQNPGKTSFNPFFIYSGVGLGKTHLAHAIGLETKKNFPDKIVLYVSAEQFVHQYTDSCKNNTRNDFLQFYQMIDLLIIDDIQFFAKKTGTQDVFFHIFNTLHSSGKQIIISSDKTPAELCDFEQRVISRLKWGLSADLQSPDTDTKIKILKSKLYKDGIEMTDDIIEYLAYNINTSIRELEGALISLLAQSSFNKKTITMDLASEMIDKFIRSNVREVSIEYIQKVVFDYFNIPIAKIQSLTRKREIVQARQLAMYFSKKHTKNSLAIIGTKCGNKDHATVLHACKAVKNLYNTDKKYKAWVDDLEKRISN
ncbi:MAG TPA: chromosomal replication initiator protein DnaA [Bacteroidales bacterium]|nr:chromosomal replication initiator protein DnaA [Bacteroidales bacterium]